jgi:hypothetical protein
MSDIVINKKSVSQSDIDRFWSRVDIRSEDECWEWQAGKNSSKKRFNYGIFWICGTSILTHRLALSFHLGKYVGPKDALHSCDNPPCCNPFHLSPGTQLENMRDMNRKGRRICERGSRRYNAKLDEAKVLEILRFSKLHQEWLDSPSKKYNKAFLARKFKVDGAVIQLILQGKAWKHVERL